MREFTYLDVESVGKQETENTIDFQIRYINKNKYSYSSIDKDNIVHLAYDNGDITIVTTSTIIDFYFHNDSKFNSKGLYESLLKYNNNEPQLLTESTDYEKMLKDSGY